jgi:hypothetical protein
MTDSGKPLGIMLSSVLATLGAWVKSILAYTC